MNNPVASLEVIGIQPGGAHFTIAAHIGQPYRDEDGAWACAVEMKPLFDKLADIRGIDSFHATWLACSLILKLLEHFRAGGGRLYNEDGSDFPLDAYLRGLDSNRPEPV